MEYSLTLDTDSGILKIVGVLHCKVRLDRIDDVLYIIDQNGYIVFDKAGIIAAKVSFHGVSLLMGFNGYENDHINGEVQDSPRDLSV